jgi:hypothetical protein
MIRSFFEQIFFPAPFPAIVILKGALMDGAIKSVRDRSAQKAISRSIAGDFRGPRLATRTAGSEATSAFGARAARLPELVAGIRFRIDVNRERFPIGGTEAGRSYDA